MKTLAQYFTDWESHTFGFGYGTGEPHTVPVIQQFFGLCSDEGAYDYRELERGLGPVPAWLLINRFCGHGVDILDYGTSPRHGWLTSEGKRLKAFLADKPADDLVSMCASRSEDYNYCYPDACNCGPNGYEEGRKCGNPFWIEH